VNAMLTFALDATKADAILANMQKDIDRLGTQDMPAEMQAWQDDEFNRKKPNLASGRVGYRGYWMITKFWQRYKAKRINPKIGPTPTWGKRKMARKPWILRPEKQVLLYQREVALAIRKLVWHR